MSDQSNHTEETNTPGNWIRMSFKGNKVWVEADEKQHPLVKTGKVRIKYNLKQNYEYQVKLENLEPESSAVPSQGKGKKKEGKRQSSHRSSVNDQNQEESITKNTIVIYTDGASSGNPGPAGIGILLRHGENEKEISEYIGHATNNIAELSAIQRALSQLKRHDLPVRLFTDSTYSLGVLTKRWKARKNQELISETKALMEKFSDLKLIKIKGHAGFEGNETADALATRAVKQHR